MTKIDCASASRIPANFKAVPSSSAKPTARSLNLPNVVSKERSDLFTGEPASQGKFPLRSDELFGKSSQLWQARNTGAIGPVPQELIPDPLPDPFATRIVKIDGAGREVSELWMTGTSNEQDATFPLYRSLDEGASWHRAVDEQGKPRSVFAAGEMPSWIHLDRRDRWAPEIHQIDGQLACLYTGRHEEGDLRIGIAIADRMEGPWKDLGPKVVHEHGVIDATVVTDPRTGEWVMIYKPDSNAVHLPTPIVARPFTLEGDQFAFTGSENEILISGAGHGGVLEGQFFVPENGGLEGVISSDVYVDHRYKTWTTTIADPQNGRASEPVLLLSSDSKCLKGLWVGPGHPSLVKIGDGRYRIYLHAYKKGTDGGPKETRMVIQLTLSYRDENGQPCAGYIEEERRAEQEEAAAGPRGLFDRAGDLLTLNVNVNVG